MTSVPFVGEIDTPKPGLPRYISQLDGLRAIAVFTVILHHFSSWGGRLRLGLYGVYIFFVLSGFLITRILLGCRDDIDAGRLTTRRSLKQFYIRRFLRIFPLYYAYLFLGLLFNIGGIRYYWIWFATYLGNMFIVYSSAWDWIYVHFWSLAVEEQFYLLWPWVILLLPRRSLVFVCLLCIGIGTASKSYFHFHSVHPFATDMLLPDCLDTLASGALLAILSQWTSGIEMLRWSLKYLTIPGCVLLLLGSSMSEWYIPELALSAGICLIGPWLILRTATVTTGTLAKMLSWAPLRYLGTISYGIYVWHLAAPIFLRSAQRHLHFPEYGQTADLLIITGLSIMMASVSWWLYERPINELKRYFPYRLPSASTSPTSAV